MSISPKHTWLRWPGLIVACATSILSLFGLKVLLMAMIDEVVAQDAATRLFVLCLLMLFVSSSVAIAIIAWLIRDLHRLIDNQQNTPPRSSSPSTGEEKE